MQQFPERILKTLFMRRHFVSECQTSACVCACVCVCEATLHASQIKFCAIRTHTAMQAHCAYGIRQANSFNLANPSIFKDHEGNSMTKAQRNLLAN